MIGFWALQQVDPSICVSWKVACETLKTAGKHLYPGTCKLGLFTSCKWMGVITPFKTGRGKPCGANIGFSAERELDFFHNTTMRNYYTLPEIDSLPVPWKPSCLEDDPTSFLGWFRPIFRGDLLNPWGCIFFLLEDLIHGHSAPKHPEISILTITSWKSLDKTWFSRIASMKKAGWKGPISGSGSGSWVPRKQPWFFIAENSLIP